MSPVLLDANIDAGCIQLSDDGFVITPFRATVLDTGDFPGDAVGPLQVLDEIDCKCTNVARRFRERCADVDGQPHLSSESEALRREAGGFKRCRPVIL